MTHHPSPSSKNSSIPITEHTLLPDSDSAAVAASQSLLLVSDGTRSPSWQSRPAASSLSLHTKHTAPQADDELSSASTSRTLVNSPASNSSQHLDEKSIGWRDLPKKGQLALLTLARLSEPLSERSFAAYIFYQVRSFDPTQSDSTITARGGLLTAAFAGAQCFTAVWWGRAADSPRMGRKRVILIGLTGTAAATLGVGFSRSFAAALTCRFIAGALNGNIGVMRTMISEMIEDRKYQSRAFLLLPMCFNIGVVIGPMMGGFLADPINAFPRAFGPGSTLGGKDGVGWMTRFPYALPNLVSASLIFLAAIGVLLGLDETHRLRKHRQDWGRRMGTLLQEKLFVRRGAQHRYQPVDTEETELGVVESGKHHPQIDTAADDNHGTKAHRQDGFRSDNNGNQQDTTNSPVRRTLSNSGHDAHNPASHKDPSILTSNVVLTLLSHFLVALHISSFNTLIFLFLPNPRAPDLNASASHFTLRFTGGLGMTSKKVGMATAIMGIIGLPLQVLIFPTVKARLGTLKCYRWFLPFSVLAYVTLPFLVLIPPDRVAALWLALGSVLAAQVVSRTFALPSTAILVNNSAPSRDVLGTVHGLAQTVSSAARTIGPYLSSEAMGLGLQNNLVGAVWWALAGVVVLNWSLLWMIWEGNGLGGRA